MTKIAIFLLMILAGPGCRTGFTPPADAAAAGGHDHYFSIAADLLNKGMFLEALGVYQDIAANAAEAENRAKALLRMGTTCSLYLERYDMALEKFEEIIRTYPDSPAAPEALFNSGVVFYETGDFKRARDIFVYYCDRYPDGRRTESAKVWADSSKRQIDADGSATPPAPRKRIADTSVRVLLEEGAETATVSSAGAVSVFDAITGKTLYQGPGPLGFSQRGGTLAVGGRPIASHMCRVSAGGPTLRLGQRRYRGYFVISAGERGMTVVNYLPVEAYLYGVLPAEVPYRWDPQALKAQAVAARTYALYVKQKRRDKPYDLQATTASQAYGGFDAEKAETNLAVDGTRGLVMTYRGKLIIAYYHADSGGHTEDAKYVWTADIPYLKGFPDRYCRDVPGSEWSTFVTYGELAGRLNDWGADINSVEALKVEGTSPSGRILQVTVVSDKGPRILSANNFRTNLGGTRLKSTRFSVTPKAHGVLISGRGYGHGVGMSQWGALRMAQAGHTFQEILTYYYRDVKIRVLTSL